MQVLDVQVLGGRCSTKAALVPRHRVDSKSPMQGA